MNTRIVTTVALGAAVLGATVLVAVTAGSAHRATWLLAGFAGLYALGRLPARRSRRAVR